MVLVGIGTGQHLASPLNLPQRYSLTHVDSADDTVTDIDVLTNKMYTHTSSNTNPALLTQATTTQSSNPRVRRPRDGLNVEAKCEGYRRRRPLCFSVHAFRQHAKRQQTGLPPRYGKLHILPLNGLLHISRRPILCRVQKSRKRCTPSFWSAWENYISPKGSKASLRI